MPVLCSVQRPGLPSNISDPSTLAAAAGLGERGRPAYVGHEAGDKIAITAPIGASAVEACDRARVATGLAAIILPAGLANSARVWLFFMTSAQGRPDRSAASSAPKYRGPR